MNAPDRGNSERVLDGGYKSCLPLVDGQFFICSYEYMKRVYSAPTNALFGYCIQNLVVLITVQIFVGG